MEHLKRGDGLSALGKANARYAFENGTMIRTGVIVTSDFDNEPPHLEVESLSQEQVFEVFKLFVTLKCCLTILYFRWSSSRREHTMNFHRICKRWVTQIFFTT